MDNFILYDEIAKSDTSIIYKGRRKGSINFVAIHCIEKHLRPEITNLVRLTFEMSHRNVVKFHEWYETSNHLWLVVELCTAGTLDAIMLQDKCFPESSIRDFGVDLCEGLHYVHSLGIVFCDLIPSKIMVDGDGRLKLSDFGFAKAENEDLEVMFRETLEATSTQWSQSNMKQPREYKKPFGDIHCIAPEVLSGHENTPESDLWSMGCVFYRMYTGEYPFISADAEQLKNMIIHKDFPNPKGNTLSTMPSSQFLTLLRGLLEKDPGKRMSWKQLIRHPFWEGRLKHLMPTKSIMVDGKEQIVEDENRDRPRTAAGASLILDQKPEVNASFSISSRLPVSPQSTMQTRNALQYKESDAVHSASSTTSTLVDSQVIAERNEARHNKNNEMRKLFFVPSELNKSQIIDNPKIQKPATLKYEPKVLPFNNPKMQKADTFLKLPRDELDNCLTMVKNNTNVPSDRSAGAMKLKLHLLNYIGTLCNDSSRMADAFLGIELHKELLGIIKNGNHLELRTKAARIFAILFRRATKLNPAAEMTETIQGLLDVISNNRKDVKLKQAFLPALGELMYFLSRQEERLGKIVEHWNMPSLAYVILTRSIGEDQLLNQIVCKTIENVASTDSQNVAKFFLNNQSEVINSLWSCYNLTTSSDQLKVSAMSALCMLTFHSSSVFATLVEKIGQEHLLDCLSLNNSNIQQTVLTMISMYLIEPNSKPLFDKRIVTKLVPMYENANVACRAKAYLLTYVLIKQQSDHLHLMVQSKLINSIERDNRKTFVVKEEDDYMHKIISLLVEAIFEIASAVLDETISTLESVYGRKNPSSTQTKQLKKSIPSLHVLKVLLNSQLFRAKLVDDKFVEKLSRVLKLSKSINSGELNLEQVCGVGSLNEYMDSLISILDSIIQHREILKGNVHKISKYLVPPLMDNLIVENSDLKVESLKILSELSMLFFDKQTDMATSEDLRSDFKYVIENQFFESLEKLLNQPEPLPFFSLSITQSVLNYDITLINTLKVRNILPSLMKLLQNYKTKIGSTLLTKLLNVITLWSSTVDPFDLYDNGIVESLKSILSELARVKKLDDKAAVETLIEVLKILDNLLKFVSEFVKKALQAKKQAGPSDNLAQQAEKLLHTNKRLVSFSSYLLSLLVHEDQDISELCSKILWIMMQLFGGECKELFNQENLNILSTAIMSSNAKRQKILLRILKRLITSDKQHAEQFKLIGQNVIQNLTSLKTQADSQANVTLSSALDEILKLSV